MLVKDVINFYGSASNVARVLNVTRQAVSIWVNSESKHVPEKQALKLEKLTGGKLKYNMRDYL